MQSNLHRYLLFLLCFVALSAQAQLLKKSPAEDTIVYYYPLDSAQLHAIAFKKAGLDSPILYRNAAIRFNAREDAQKKETLAYGTYLRSSIYGFQISRSIYVRESRKNTQFIQDGPQSFLLIKDPKSNRLLKHLKLYFAEKAQISTFAAGRGGYPVLLRNEKDIPNYFLMNDGGIWTLKVFNSYAKNDSKVSSEQNKDKYYSNAHPNASYLILSKPKYKPGDTLKAYTYQIVGKRGRPIHSKMVAYIQDLTGRTLWKGKIKPKKAGSYRLNFPIPDSFVLNTRYKVLFEYFFNETWHQHQQFFIYEDYKLEKTLYDFVLTKPSYKAGDSINCLLSARDENGFADPFGKYEIDVYVRNIAGISRDTLGFDLQKSIYHYESSLSGDGIETINIPADRLPQGQSTVSVQCKLINEQNEELKWNQDFFYDNNPHTWSFEQQADTLIADYQYLRAAVSRNLRCVVQDFHGDTIADKYFRTPLRLGVRANFAKVTFWDSGKLLHELPIKHNIAQGIGLQTCQTGDSIYISFQSHGDETVYYTILKNGKEILADSGLSLRFTAPAAAKDHYELLCAVELQHSPDAFVNYGHWHIIPNEKKLVIEDNFPDEVLPGSDIAVTLKVRDYRGKPLKNVDMSSYGFKSRFNDDGSTMQFFLFPPLADTLYEKVSPAMWQLTSVVNPDFRSSRHINLADIKQYDLFRYPYYQFYFRTDKIYREDFALKGAQAHEDSTAILGLTLGWSGKIYSPAWITADGIPIFYAATARECLAMLPAGKHKIQFQLSNILYELEPMDFLPGFKKMIHINQDSGEVTLPGLRILRKDMPTLELDSGMRENILRHSLLINNLPVLFDKNRAPARLRFPNMTRHMSPSGIGEVDMEGTMFKFVGPYYETKAVMTVDSIIRSLPIGDGLLHYYTDSSAQIAAESRPVPALPWLITVREFRFDNLFDTLYWPQVPKASEKYVPAKMSQTDGPYQGTVKAPSITPQFGNYWKARNENATQLSILNYEARLTSLAIVSKTDIAQSTFYVRDQSGQIPRSVTRNGIYDLYFQLADGTERVYKNVNFAPYTHFYVNLDSIKGATVSEADLRFYNNAYLSLKGSFDEYFTEYPDKVRVYFSKIQGARNNVLLVGRLWRKGHVVDNIYLERDGRFVAGAQTDKAGNFQFLNIPAGTYMIKVHPSGSRPLYVYNLRMEANSAYTIDITPIEDTRPLLLAGGNKYFRLDVWQKPDSGFVQLMNGNTQELLSKGTITYTMEGKCVYTSSITGSRATFPLSQWPEGKPVDMLVAVPGYTPIHIQNLTTIPDFSYQWQFLLTPLVNKDVKEEPILIQGASITNALPTVNSIFHILDTLRPAVYGPNYEIHLRVEDSEHQLVTPGAPLICQLYRDNKLLQTAHVAAGPDIVLFRPESAGSYILRVASEGKATQIISFTLTTKGKYYLLPDPFKMERIIPAQEDASDKRNEYSGRSDGDYSNRSVGRMYSSSGAEIPALSANAYQTRSGSALSIGGARADRTVYVIDGQTTRLEKVALAKTTPQSEPPRQALSEEQARRMNANPAAQKLREHYSDASHFETGLRTNKKGSTQFHLSFPDDITRWDLYQTALGKHYVYGNSIKKVSAFKPVMAIVRTPRYLYRGDYVEIGLNLRNLTERAKEADWQTSVDSQIILHHSGTLMKGLSDSGYYLATRVGEIEFRSGITTKDSFGDRELRTISVLKPAVDVYTDTSFAVVDTAFTITKDTNEQVMLQISQTLNDYFYQTIASLEAYPYSCVEQQCSKIKALLYAQKLAEHTSQPFTKRRQLKKMIDKLQESQSGDGGYGWWKDASNIPISIIVYETLHACADAGYEGYNPYCRPRLHSFLINMMSSSDKQSRFSILACLLAHGVDVKPYKPYVDSFRLNQFTLAADRLNFLMVKGKISDTFNQREIFLCLQMMQQNMQQGSSELTFTEAPAVRLLNAFRLFRYTPLADSIGPYMQHYIDGGFHMRAKNTLEQSLTLQTFYEFSQRKQKQSKSTYQINEGKVQQLFPLKLSLREATTRVRYKGLKGWARIDRIRLLEHPAAKDTFFKINARLQTEDEKNVELPKLNSNYNIKANVYNYKTYSHVMVCVPIPAGMVLKHKIPLPRDVSHIDYFNNRIVLYYTHLSSGNHSFSIPVRATFRGDFVWAPIRAELMYDSRIYGHNMFQTINIR